VIHQKTEVVQLRRVIHLLPMGGADHEEADTGEKVKGEQDLQARENAITAEELRVDTEIVSRKNRYEIFNINHYDDSPVSLVLCVRFPERCLARSNSP
jgi:hypothetical protein